MTPEELREFQVKNCRAGDEMNKVRCAEREAAVSRLPETGAATLDCPVEPDWEWHFRPKETPGKGLDRLMATCPPDSEAPPFNSYDPDNPLMLDLHWLEDGSAERLEEDRFNETVGPFVTAPPEEERFIETLASPETKAETPDSPAFTQAELNSLDGEALDAAFEVDYSQFISLSRSAQRKLRDRMLPVLREMRDRFKANLTIRGCRGWEEYLLSKGIQPATFRTWERRELAALRQGDLEELEAPREKRQPEASPAQDAGQHQANVLEAVGAIITDGFKSRAKKSHIEQAIVPARKKPPVRETSLVLVSPPEPLVDEFAASAYLGYQPITCLRMAKEGRLPSVPFPIGSTGKFRHKFKMSELESYVDSLPRAGKGT